MDDNRNLWDEEIFDKKINFAVSKNIEAARERAGLTGREMSSILKISESSYSRRENGQTAFSMDQIVKIAMVTHTPIRILVPEEQLMEICRDFKHLVDISMSQREKENLYKEKSHSEKDIMQEMTMHPMNRKTDIYKGYQPPASTYGTPKQSDDEMCVRFITEPHYESKLKALYGALELLNNVFEQNDLAYEREIARATIKYVVNCDDNELKEKLKVYLTKCKNEQLQF